MKNNARRTWLAACAIAGAALIAATACSTAEDKAAAAANELTPDGITRFQAEHGIGPVTAAVVLAPAVDQALAAKGVKVFEQKCAACHKMGERYVGPPLGEVLGRRSPTFVMNMILNPQGMAEKHPVTKKLFAEFLMAMPNQNLSQEEARQVVEYLRTQKS